MVIDLKNTRLRARFPKYLALEIWGAVCLVANNKEVVATYNEFSKFAHEYNKQIS
jgi:hypothetical protein